MMHPATRLGPVDEAQGLGVFATAFLPRGTLVWVRDPWDLEVPASIPTDKRDAVAHFAYTESDGSVVIPWDHARFVNHSCEPTCVGLLPGIDLAIRDIQPGEQITNDYVTLGTFASFPCSCGAPGCRGTVASGPVTPAHRAAFEAALALMPTVPQALGLRAQTWLTAERPRQGSSPRGTPPPVLRGRMPLR